MFVAILSCDVKAWEAAFARVRDLCASGSSPTIQVRCYLLKKMANGGTGVARKNLKGTAYLAIMASNLLLGQALGLSYRVTFLFLDRTTACKSKT